MKWFRLYTEIIDDPKLQKLSDSEFRDFIYMMCLACETEKDGLIPHSKEDIAWRLRRDVTSLCDALVTLEKQHIVNDNGEGIRFLNWEKRQYKSDTSAERTKRWREKQKSVTSPKRHCDAIEQNRDRTDTDKKKILASPSPDSRVKVFLDWWVKTYEKRYFPKKYAIPSGAKLGSQIKSLLKSRLSWHELQVCACLYLDDEEEWLLDKGHDLGILLTRLNKYNYTDKVAEAKYLKLYTDENKPKEN